MIKWFTTVVLAWGLAVVPLEAETVFLEAEEFPALSRSGASGLLHSQKFQDRM